MKRTILYLDEQINKYRSLDNWFHTPQGYRVELAFADELMLINEQIKGDNLIQLGSCGKNTWLSTLQFRNKWITAPCVLPKKTVIASSLTLLPIERDSVDCVLAPLTMEAHSQKKNPLDEIDRILKPMGYVIFLGVNPMSFWGLAFYLKRLSCFGQVTPSLTSSLTLKRMMLQRGYRQCALTSFYYIPPVTSEFFIKKLTFFNEMGKMVWPFPAAFYCLIMQKYAFCPPPLKLELASEALLDEKVPMQATNKWIHE